MDFFRRIGTDRHKYKVQFYIKRVAFNKNLPGRVYISVRRGDHKVNTEQLLPIEDKICNFKHEKLLFPGLTLFYEQSEKKYQEKIGQMKIILKTDNDQKKLLGVVPFDVAEYANEPNTKTFKVKKELQQTPSNLKGYIAFQVYIQFIGEGSQASKSLAKDDKGSVREDSPFARITGCFGAPTGPFNSQQTIKRNNLTQDVQSQQKQSSNYEKSRRRKASEEDQDQIFNNNNKNKHHKKEEDINYLKKYGKSQSKPKPKDRTDEEQQFFKRQINQDKNRTHMVQNKVNKKPVEDQGSDGVDEEESIFSNHNEDKKKVKVTPKRPQKIRQQEKNISSKPTKNFIKPTYEEAMTQKNDKGNLKDEMSVFQSQPAAAQVAKQHFYFDDPDTYPEPFRQHKKKDKEKKQEEELSKQIRLVNNNSSQNTMKREDVSEKSHQTPKRRKVKQNTIHFSQKQYKEKVPSVKMMKKQQIQEKSYKFNEKEIDENQLIDDILTEQKKQKNSSPVITKTIDTGENSKIMKKMEELNKQLLKNQKKVSERSEEVDSYKKDLQLKNLKIKELLNKVELTEELKKRLNEAENKILEGKEQNNQLKGKNNFLEKQVIRLKGEVQDMRRQMNKTESFFRMTQQRYQQQAEDENLQEQIKKLQKQKNQYLLTIQKQKDKARKDLKRFNQELEKERLKFEEYEDMSKVQLKKLKDDVISKMSNIQILKQKLKEKAKEEETLLKQNNLINGSNIELREKLASIKIKICEKLNEANENGEQEIMQVLTDLNRSF